MVESRCEKMIIFVRVFYAQIIKSFDSDKTNL